MKKKKIFLKATLISSFLACSSFFILSCKNNEDTAINNENEKLESAFRDFNIKQKSNADLNQILASSITTEQELLKYFVLLNQKENIDYVFNFSRVSNGNNTSLIVNYKIQNKTSLKSKNKEFILNGFKNPDLPEVEDKLELAFKNFNIEQKQNIDLNEVLASSINNEEELLKYFSFNKEPNIEYIFISSTVNPQDEQSLIVNYEIRDKSSLKSKNKEFILSGFKKPVLIEDKNKFETAFNEFSIQKKPNINLSNVYTGYINYEYDLLDYFNLSNIKDDVEYQFVSSKQDENIPTKLNIKFKIKYKENVRFKTIEVDGFKQLNSEEQELNDALKTFNIYLKQGKDISNILATSINNENEFDKYFDYDLVLNTNAEFVSVSQDPLNISNLIVKFKITHDNNESLNYIKRIVISGFKDPNAVDLTPEQQKLKNQEIIDEIVQLIEITSLKDHTNISARDFNNDLFNEYFKVNHEDIEDLKLTNELIFPRNYIIKRDPDNFDNVIVKIIIFVGNNNTQVKKEKIFKIENFKSLISELDKKQSPNILLPFNSKSYKAKLEPVLIKQSSEQVYKDFINNKLTYEQWKIELMYQLRFFMYQMFSDNFTELDYWIEGGQTQGDRIIAKIEGIVKDSINNLVYFPQQLGNLKSKTTNLKSGQRISIEITPINFNEWRPGGLVRFGHLDGIYGFSFAKGCNNMTSNTFIKDIAGASFQEIYFDLKIDGQNQGFQRKWTQFNSPLFINLARIPLK